MKKQLLILLCLLSISINYAQTFNDGILEYTVTSGTNVSIKKYNNICPTGTLTIPNTVIDNGTTYTITSIQYQAFRNCINLTNATIPNSVTSFGDAMSKDCTGLTNVTANWTTPLVVPTTIFGNISVNTIPLTVPSGTVALYQAATVWQDFSSIVLSTENFAENTINLQLFLNPVHNQLNITINEDILLEKILIYNNLGQLMIQSKEPTIDISKFQGIHFVQIVTNKGSVTKKIIIN